MKYEIVNRYAEAVLFSRPVCSRPFPSTDLIHRLKEAASQIFSPNRQSQEFSHALTRIRSFEHFLEFSQEKNVVPDELLLEEFRTSPEKGFVKKDGSLYSMTTLNGAIDIIRRLLNDYFYPHGFIQRPVLTKKAYLKYRRFLDLTKLTQRLIVTFEEDGRCLFSRRKYAVDPKTGREISLIQFERKSKKLSDYNRKVYIEKILTLLNVLGVRGVEVLKEADLERILNLYRKKNREDTARAYLAALYSLAGNGLALGLLKENPFDRFPLERRKPKSRNDFVLPDQMAKLLDLNSLDWDDPDAVRSRSITSLLYDTGLRVSSLTQLEIEDVREFSDGRFQITVKGIYLKGEKEDKSLYLLFQETLTLLKFWLQVVRPKFNPSTTRLFVSKQGRSLTKTGIRNIVRASSKELGIRTVKGRIPSPHTLRHTLATLNTEPYGKSVPPRLMQQRLIHMDIETFYRNYIHHNPLGEMEEYRKLLEKGSAKGSFAKMSKEDFFAVLDLLSSARPASVRDVKRAYERELGNSQVGFGTERGKFMSESDALEKLSRFGIDYRSLRTWGLRQGFCQVTNAKKGKEYRYNEFPILDLLNNYISSEEAYNKFQGSRPNFFHRLKRCRKAKIGRKSFILKEDFLVFVVKETRLHDTGASKYQRGSLAYTRG